MKSVNGWTIETLKEYVDLRSNNAREIADLKVIHLRELREADQKALDLVARNNMLHFEQLNENAKRTIEERSHFVAEEVFDPFRERVNKKLDQTEGKSSGLSQGWGILIGLIGMTGGIISIIYTFVK